MSYWRIDKADWLLRKPASFLSHLQCAIIISTLGPILSGGHAVLWALAAILAGLAWEWGYYFVVAKVLKQAPRFEFKGEGWPKLGRTWGVHVYEATPTALHNDWDATWAFGVELFRCPDRALPRAFDMVPFILGAGLGLWFTVWRLGG